MTPRGRSIKIVSYYSNGTLKRRWHNWKVLATMAVTMAPRLNWSSYTSRKVLATMAVTMARSSYTRRKVPATIVTTMAARLSTSSYATQRLMRLTEIHPQTQPPKRTENRTLSETLRSCRQTHSILCRAITSSWWTGTRGASCWRPFDEVVPASTSPSSGRWNDA